MYHGRGPFTPDDILASRMVADPFHLLDCAMTSEGACALILTTRERAQDLPTKPVYILGGACDSFGPSYQHPPAWDLAGPDGQNNGYTGRWAAQKSFAMAELGPTDVDVCEFYDPFSFENHPPVRGLRVLRGGRGRRLHHGRPHRPRRPVPGDHRRGHDVVQPRRGRSAAAPAG